MKTTTVCDLCLFLHKICCKMVWKFCEIWIFYGELSSWWAKFCEILSHSVRYGMYAFCSSVHQMNMEKKTEQHHEKKRSLHIKLNQSLRGQVLFFHWSLALAYDLRMWTVQVLARLHICVVSPEPLLFVYAINYKASFPWSVLISKTSFISKV